MKHIIVSAILSLGAIISNAQTINFCNGNVTYSFPAEIAGEMTFTGETVQVSGRQFNLSEWFRITVDNSDVVSNTVNVMFSDNGASVTVSGNIAEYVDVNVTGAHVIITQAETVSETTCGEITYILKGEASDGSLTLNGSYKSTVELQGVALTNPAGAALNIQNGKRIALSAKNGTQNFLTDGNGS